jgi:hypothetical protein
MKRLSLLIILLPYLADCQSVTINPASTNANLIEIQTGHKSVLVPRLSSTQRIAIPTPQKGTLVFDITTNSFWFHNGTSWVEMNKNNEWRTTDNNIQNLNSGKVGFGVVPTKSKLEVNGSGDSQAVFGSLGKGISFNNYSATIGLNNYRNSSNVINHFTPAYSKDIQLNPTNGILYYQGYRSGTATENPPAADEVSLAMKNNGNVYIGHDNSYLNSPFPGSNLNVASGNGRTRLGLDAPQIRVRTFSGTTCSFGSCVTSTISTGIPADKVLAVSIHILVDNYFEYLPPGNNNNASYTQCNYFYYMDGATIKLQHTAGQSDYTQNRPYIATIIFEN